MYYIQLPAVPNQVGIREYPSISCEHGEKDADKDRQV